MHLGWGHGKRYFQCTKCKRIFKAGVRSIINSEFGGSGRWPTHCQREMKFLKDSEARSIIEKRKPRSRLKSIMSRRESRVRKWKR